MDSAASPSSPSLGRLFRRVSGWVKALRAAARRREQPDEGCSKPSRRWRWRSKGRKTEVVPPAGDLSSESERAERRRVAQAIRAESFGEFRALEFPSFGGGGAISREFLALDVGVEWHLEAVDGLVPEVPACFRATTRRQQLWHPWDSDEVIRVGDVRKKPELARANVAPASSAAVVFPAPTSSEGKQE